MISPGTRVGMVIALQICTRFALKTDLSANASDSFEVSFAQARSKSHHKGIGDWS